MSDPASLSHTVRQVGFTFLIAMTGFASDAAEPNADKANNNVFQFSLHSRTQTDDGEFLTTVRKETWKPSKTAVIVCDMWDLHHCLNATRRGAEMAPRMNRVLHTARDMGATIIHAPSSCTAAYADHPARKRAQSTPRAKSLPEDIGKWCYKIPAEEKGVYPIDQSNGGEDDDPAEHAEWAKKLTEMGRNPKAPWKSQTDALDIEDEDFISDDGEEVWSILEHKGIDNVVLVGVHTNMCVLGRPFGLRQMSKNGKNVVLMRDMTDTMYDPTQAPYVSHFTGTDLIVEHIEKYVCPTIVSTQVLGDEAAFTFKNDKRKHLVLVTVEREYKTQQSLPEFAKKHLGKDFRISHVQANPLDRNDLPGIEVLKDADVLFLSVRRRVLPPEQMKIVRDFIESGKPVLGIRTASHAFSLRNEEPPEGYVAWPELDQEVLGGNYHGHHGNGPVVTVKEAKGAGDHEILQNVDLSDFKSRGSLYEVRLLAKTATPLLTGSIPNEEPEPIAWTNRRKSGGRTFYTSLGHIKDFESPEFNRFLKNAVYWTSGLPVPD